MKNLIIFFSLIIMMVFAHPGTAQDAEKVRLEQMTGKFVQTSLTLEAGKTYVFEVANKGVDHEVGFVLAPKGKPEQQFHIQEAYLKAAVKDGEMSSSREVTLEKGEYIYFCPLNPTPQYTLTVK
jgi:hypothetical protein